jgi:uncharacterized membrane protein
MNGPPTTRPAVEPPRSARAGMNVWSGVLLGLGLVAFIDETVFHQILHWHHFYDLSTTEVGLVSDGIFHAFSWFATVAGLFMVAQLRRVQAFHGRRFLGGLLAGSGFFQLYDARPAQTHGSAPDPLRRRHSAL